MAISSTQEVLAKIAELHSELKKPNSEKASANNGSKSDFLNMVKDGIQNVNEMQKTADKMSMELASGKTESLHETMLSVSQAELTFNLMVQMRNRALEAYQEVMRMPV